MVAWLHIRKSDAFIHRYLSYPLAQIRHGEHPPGERCSCSCGPSLESRAKQRLLLGAASRR